jgi:hypothetical protein
MSQDAEHLHLLSVFHFVLAGICAVFALFPFAYLIFGLVMMGGGLSPDRPGELPAAFGGCFVAGLGGVFLASLTAYAVALYLAGRYLKERRRHTFCVVVAAISCAFQPIGTVLGVFTLVVLFRPAVKAMFGLRAGSDPGNGSDAGPAPSSA